MAKKKNNELIKLLDEKIAQSEKAIIKHDAQAALDFEKLFRYLKLRNYYDETKEVIL